MNEKIEQAKAVLEYTSHIQKSKEDNIKEINSKLNIMLIFSGLLLVAAILMSNAAFAMGTTMILISIFSIIFALSSIVIFIIGLWSKNSEHEFSDLMNKNLFENGDLFIFYREQINNLKINFIVLDKIIERKKSLLFSASICIFTCIGAIVSMLVVLATFLQF